MRCFLEIQTGQGRYSTIEDFGFYTANMASLWQIAGLYIEQLSTVGASGVQPQLEIAIENMRQPAFSLAVPPLIYPHYEQAHRYLAKLRDGCELNEFCTFRVIASTYNNVFPPQNNIAN
jgi:hypothetical protein